MHSTRSGAKDLIGTSGVHTTVFAHKLAVVRAGLSIQRTWGCRATDNRRDNGIQYSKVRRSTIGITEIQKSILLDFVFGNLLYGRNNEISLWNWRSALTAETSFLFRNLPNFVFVGTRGREAQKHTMSFSFGFLESLYTSAGLHYEDFQDLHEKKSCSCLAKMQSRDNEECPICYLSVDKKSCLVCLRCGYAIHKSCFENMRRKNCPMCRFTSCTICGNTWQEKKVAHLSHNKKK